MMNSSNSSSHTALLFFVQKTTRILLILALSFFIGFIDYLTGPDYTFSLFYLILPTFAAWKMSRPLALFAAFTNSFIWLWGDFSSERFSLAASIYVWNFASRLIILIIVGILVSSVRKSMDQEKKLSRVDPLTKALNLRAFKELLEVEINRSLRYNHSMTLVYFDIDNFKSVNDTFGHAVGDKVLATISKAVKKTIRQNDVFGRLGGDEFAILLVETDTKEAHLAVSKVQKALEPIIQKNKWPISLSIGVLTFMDSFCDSEKAISLADQLMYSVKKSTKNDANYAIYTDDE